MKIFKNTITFIATFLFLTAVTIKGSQMDPFPIEVIIEPVPAPSAAGPVNLQVKIILKSVCHNAKFLVSGVDNLQFSGDTVWNLSSNPKDTTVLNLQVVIPDNDTSGIGFTCYFSEKGKFQSSAYFVAGSEKVSFHHGNPRRVSRTPMGVPIDMSDPAKTDEIGESKGTICYEDEDGNLVPIDSIVNGLSPSGKRVGTIDHDGNFIPLDSLLKLGSVSAYDSTHPAVVPDDRSKVWTHDAQGNQIRVDRDSLMNALKEQKLEKEYENMRQLEQSPLTTYDKQYIKVDGKNYRRYRGEYKFHLVETITDPISQSEKYRDSLNISKGKVFEFNFDLRDPAKLKYAKSKIDNLAPTDSAGFYRATIDWQTVLDCKEKGIVFHRIGWQPRGEAKPSPDDSAEKKN